MVRAVSTCLAAVLCLAEARGDFVVGTLEGMGAPNASEAPVAAVLGLPSSDVKFLAKAEAPKDQFVGNPTAIDGLTVQVT